MKKVLVAYATWSGTAHEVADQIGKTLETRGFSVDVRPAKEVRSIDSYQGIVLGTSIHASQTVGAFRRFLSRHNGRLRDIPTAYFAVCMNMMEDTEDNRRETKSWLEKVTGKYPEIQPISVGLFGGAVLTSGKDYQSLNFFVRKIIDAMKSKIEEDYGKTDFRDWAKIEEWSQELAKSI